MARLPRRARGRRGWAPRHDGALRGPRRRECAVRARAVDAAGAAGAGLDGAAAPFFDLDRFCAPSKGDAIYGGELPLSRAILDAGLSLGEFLLAHGGRGARIREPPGNATAQTCADLRAATELQLGDVYFPGEHKDVRPLEAIFFKTARSGIYRDDVDRLAGGATPTRASTLQKTSRRRSSAASATARTPTSPWPTRKHAAATRDAHRADIEAALLAANGAVERARADVARLQRRCG